MKVIKKYLCDKTTFKNLLEINRVLKSTTFKSTGVFNTSCKMLPDVNCKTINETANIQKEKMILLWTEKINKKSDQ